MVVSPQPYKVAGTDVFISIFRCICGDTNAGKKG
jgi:hypothetical protein